MASLEIIQMAAKRRPTILLAEIVKLDRVREQIAQRRRKRSSGDDLDGCITRTPAEKVREAVEVGQTCWRSRVRSKRKNSGTASSVRWHLSGIPKKQNPACPSPLSYFTRHFVALGARDERIANEEE